MLILRQQRTRLLLPGLAILIILVAFAQTSFSQHLTQAWSETVKNNEPTRIKFTYKGQLKEDSMPAHGTYAFQFALYNNQSGDHKLALATKDYVVLTNGSFTIQLEFVSADFSNNEVWLELGMRPANSAGPYKTLSPRQRMPKDPTPTAAMLVGNPVSFAQTSDPISTTIPPQDSATWIKTEGTVRLANSTDNVGIGTEQPKAKLDVKGDIHASESLRVGNSVGIFQAGALNIIEVDSNPLAIGFSNPMSANPNPIAFSAIQLGIGTTNPTTTLDVNGRARIRTLTGNASLNDVVVADPNGILFRRPATTLGGGNSWLLTGNALTGNEFLGTISNHPLRLFTNNTEQMRILANGNVGLGTTTPNHKLVLGSGNIFMPTANGGTDGNLYFGGVTDSSQVGMRLFGGVVNTSTPGGFIDVMVNPTNLADGLRFRVDASNGGSERMRITAAGNVGIGTPAPAARLSVGNNTFQVDAFGNLIRINNVTYSWPTSQGTPNTILTNNGSGFLSWAPVPTGGVTGNCPSGANVVPKWSSTSALTCSQIFDNGTNVGIGTTSPNERLEITGNLRLPASTATVGVIKSGGNRFIHSFNGPSNFFAGVNAGNFTVSGTANTAVGGNALISLSTGPGNTAIGFQTLRANTTGANNTGLGSLSLTSNVSGNNNTAAGFFALQNTTGSNNTGLGTSTLVFNTVGSNNTAVGSNAGGTIGLIGGSRNVFIGAFAGNVLANGSDNIYISHNGAATESNTIRIGTNSTRTFIAGIRNVTTGVANAIPVVIDSNGQLGTVSSSRRFKEHIEEIGAASEVLYRLRPVSFLYKPEYGGRPDLPQFGLIAEEVAKVAPELVAYDNDGKPHTVNYQFLLPLLLNEMQKKDAEIEKLQTRLDSLEKVVKDLRKK